MSTASSDNELGESERTVLEALRASEDGIERRVDLADVVAESYPPIERSLTSQGLIKEVGAHNVVEDEELVTYRRLAITDDGDLRLRHPSPDEADQEPDPVQPTRRRTHTPWFKTAALTEFSEDVPRLLEATQSVEFDEEADEVRVTMEVGDREATLTFNRAQWFNTGHRRFAEQYHARFNERNSITEREFGILQAHWINR